MSRLLRHLPAILRIAFAESLAYRGEMFVWLLSTNTPLVMLLLWGAVAAEHPVGPYGEAQFVAYFLVTLIVRLLTGGWVVWEMNMEIKSGDLARRLLRPVHPFVSYAAENVGGWPLPGAGGTRPPRAQAGALARGCRSHVLHGFTARMATRHTRLHQCRRLTLPQK